MTTQKRPTLTAKRYERVAQDARARHDARYSADHPPPTLEGHERENLSKVERAANYLWAIWLVLAIAGALVAAPHSLKILSETVDLPAVFAAGYGLAAFVGLELGLLALAFVSALYNVHHIEARKQASLAGAINALAQRIGTRPPFDLSHLPDRRNKKRGVWIVGLLLLASLTFNLSDTITDTALLSPYADQIHLIARVASGVLGPCLLVIAGHYAATEAVQTGTRRQRAETGYTAALSKWQTACNSSWAHVADDMIRAVLVERGFEVPDEYAETDYIPFGRQTATNGQPIRTVYFGAETDPTAIRRGSNSPAGDRPLF
jgi:hypothetical protein